MHIRNGKTSVTATKKTYTCINNLSLLKQTEYTVILIYIIMFIQSDVFVYAKHLNVVERNVFFFMMMTNSTNKKGRKNQTVSLARCILFVSVAPQLFLP